MKDFSLSLDDEKKKEIEEENDKSSDIFFDLEFEDGELYGQSWTEE